MMLSFLSRLGASERFLLGVAGIVGLVLLADWLVATPMIARTRALEAELEQALGKLEYNRRVLQRQASVSAAHEQVGDLIGRASTDEAASIVTAEVDELAIRMGVELNRREAREPTRLSYCEEHIVDVGEFTAALPNLVSFLHALHETPGMLRVIRLKVAPEKGTGRLKGGMVVTKVVAPTDA